MKFDYASKTIDGRLVKGSIDAPNEAAASKALHEKKLFVLDLKSEKTELPGLKKNLDILGSLTKKVSLKDKIIFTQQLAMMIRAGLPLTDAFKALEEQTDNKYFSEVIADIALEVKGGKALSLSLGKYPKIFNKLYTSIIVSGEKSGKLDEVLDRLADQLQKDYDLITKIKAAVSYPILVVGALIVIVIIMMIFVVPQLKSIFSDLGVELPLVTRIVLGTSDALRNYWYIFLAALIAIYVGIRMATKTPQGQLAYDKFKIKIPIIGNLTKKIYVARFTRTMGTLVASGLPVLDILETVKGVINNKVYQNAFAQISSDIEGGLSLSDGIRKQKIFPPMIYHLISVGEKSGKLDYVLSTTANFFDKEVEAQTNNLATLIEPILIILIGAGVGLVVASVLMPIYSLVNTL